MNKLTKLLIDLLDQKVNEQAKAASDQEWYMLMGQIKLLTHLLRESEKGDLL